MERVINWGILGPGSIANQFARGLSAIPDAKLVAVGSRSIDRANSFGDKYNVPRRYASYAELVSDPEVDAIYVSTPHPFHKDCTILCLEGGKAVICEKPLTVNAKQAKEVIDCARKNKKFLMEAMWTRFLPVIVKVREWLAQGAIGDVRMLTADFGFRSGWNPEGRLLNPELAGGGIMDVGIYTVAMAYMVFGEAPSSVTSMAHVGETGVDEQAAMLLGYDEGQIAMLSCAVRTNIPHDAKIMGTDGHIIIPGFWHTNSATLYAAGKEPEKVEIPFVGNGYNYEAVEVMNCLREGKLESSVIPLDESLSIMETMDEIRSQCGVKFPMED